jgi:hypothetical protein
MGRLSYNEIAHSRFKQTRDVVVSEAFLENGKKIGYSIAERLTVSEEQGETRVFLRGGLGIVDKEGLFALKKTIDEACERVKKEEQN